MVGRAAEGQCGRVKLTFQTSTDVNPMKADRLSKFLLLSFFIFCEDKRLNKEMNGLI